jgi:hypothetical protein
MRPIEAMPRTTGGALPPAQFRFRVASRRPVQIEEHSSSPVFLSLSLGADMPITAGHHL